MKFPTPPARRLPFVAVALLLFSGAEADDNKDRPLPLSIFCFDYAPDLRSVQVKRSPSEFAEVKLSTANVVDAGLVLTDAGSISLYGAAPGAGLPTAVASAKPEPSLKSLLMILIPADEEGGSAYRSHLVERDLPKFPMGSSLFVNLSPHDIRIQLGEETFEIEPGAERLIEPKASPGDVMAVNVEYRAEDHWLSVSSSRWAHRMDRRSLVTIHQSPQSGRVVMKSIPLRE